MLESRIAELFPDEKNEIIETFHLPLIEKYLDRINKYGLTKNEYVQLGIYGNIYPNAYNIFKYFFSLITKLYANYLFYNTIVKNVDFNEIKLIHVHNLNFLICGIWLKKKFNKKIFLSIGGTDILRLRNKILFKKLIKNVDKIFSVSVDLK